MSTSRGQPKVEIESKFDVPADFVVPTLADVGPGVTVGEPVELHLEATYFDTADLRLAHAGIALRRRTGGTDDGWHLKISRGPDERIEVQRPLGRDPATVPDALADLVLARSRRSPLVPIANLRTHRVVLQLLGPGDLRLAEVADDRVTGESGSAVSAWREVEVELVEGDRDLLAAVGARLEQTGAEPSGSASKLTRLLAFEGSGEEVPEAGPKSTAGEVALAYLAAQVAALLDVDPFARVDAPDAVHKMRVAVRRLRSALATYRRLLDRSVTDPVRDELRWVGHALGPVRDSEVIRDHLRQEVADQPRPTVVGPVSRRIDRTLRAEHRDSHREALTELGSDRYLALLGAVEEIARGRALSGKRADQRASKQVPREVRRTFDRMVDFVEQADAAASPEETDRLLHEVRKAAKRVRYAAESAEPAVGSGASDLAKQMEELQDVLGAHQDTVVVRQLLLRLGAEAHEAGDSAFTFGRLHALEEWRAARTRDQYDELIDGLIKRPKWLR